MNSARLFVESFVEPKMADFADDFAFAVGQWVLPGRQNSVRRKPREKSKIDQTLRSGSFEFDLCQKSRGSSPKRTNSIPASRWQGYVVSYSTSPTAALCESHILKRNLVGT